MFTLSRLIAMIGLAEARDFRRRAVRTIILSVLLLILALFALGFALAALAVWLARFMAVWQALLLVAGLLLVIFLILGLVLRHRPAQRRVVPAPLADNAETAIKSINPMVLIGFAAVAGIVLGRRAMK